MAKLVIAKISKPQGIRGELKCQVLTDVLAVFDNTVMDFYVSGKPMHAEKVCFRQGAAYIKFEGVNTRNEAELFRNKEISLDKETVEKFLQDEILIDDLIGLVICDEEGFPVGQIVDYESYGAADILTIFEDGHEYQVPFIKEIFKQNGKKLFVDRQKYNENKI